jgi:hypothetical protein
MLVSDHIAVVANTLQDTGNVTWTVAQHITYLNDALRAAVSVRPDISAVTAGMLLTANTTLQTLPAATDLRLIAIECNLGSDGLTVGDTVRLGDKQAMDDFLLGWRSVTGATAVKEYFFDDARPDEFEVYPRPHATTPVYVRVKKSVLPTSMAVVGDTIPVKDIHAPALREWCCYLAFSRDSERTPNWQRGARHFAAFFNLLQVKMKADMAINPKVRAMVEKAQ